MEDEIKDLNNQIADLETKNEELEKAVDDKEEENQSLREKIDELVSDMADIYRIANKY